MAWWSRPGPPVAPILVKPMEHRHPRSGDLLHARCRKTPWAPERLTAAEISILEHLAAAYNELSALEDHHPHDLEEFVEAIHHAERIVICRAARRVNRDVLR